MEIFLETAENCREEYEVKRMHEIHTEEVNQKVTFFLEQTKGIYEDVQHSDGYLYLQDLVDWLDLTELIVNENEVQRCFALSKMPVIKEFMIGGKSKYKCTNHRLQQYGVCRIFRIPSKNLRTRLLS